MWCGNLGDCRACFIPLTALLEDVECSADDMPNQKIIKSDLNIVWLSRDMKSCLSYERERIEKAGGRVMDGRVEGLEPSRTVGDFDVKIRLPPGVISTTPEFRTIDLSDYGPGIVVAATDGIWDVMMGRDIATIVRDACLPFTEESLLGGTRSEQQKFLKNISGDIVRTALVRGSADDCTAISTLVTSL